MKTTWKETTLNRIYAQHITEAEMRHMRLRLKRAFNACYFGLYKNYDVSHDDACAIVDAVETVAPSVLHAQCVAGAKWLHDMAFKKDGTQRQTEAARELRESDLQIIRDLQIDPMFRLVGFEMPERGRYVEAVLPIYRAQGNAGSFDYVAAPWQSGYKFAIVGRDYK